MESFEIKMKPIIIRDGPSRKVVKIMLPNSELYSTEANLLWIFQANFKIQAAKLAYEIYSMTQRLRYTTFRAENEEKVDFNDHEIICTFLEF